MVAINIFKIIFLILLVVSQNAIAEKQPDKLIVILDWFANPNHAPLFVAQQQGFFREQHLDVELITPADPNDPPKLVAAGKADIAITYQPQFIIQTHQGLPLVRVATLIASPLNCLVVSANSSIRTLADLKGKRIGYSADSTDNVIMAAMLSKQHLSLKDVELINVHYGLTQALMAGKVDAVTGMMRNFELNQLKLAGFAYRAFFPEEQGVPSYDELILVTHRKKLTDPRLPRFVAAMKKGVDYLLKHPQQSWEQFAKNHPEANDELNRRAWYGTLQYFPRSPADFDEARYQRIMRFFLS